MDVLTCEQRSYNMSRVLQRDTKPERIVRSTAHRLGYRFRLNRRDLPGTPDLVFPRLHKIILVHGCFWHRHRCRYGRPKPTTRPAFWRAKFEANRKRDRRVKDELRRDGWKVLVVWECQTRDLPGLEARLSAFLDPRLV